MFVGVFLTPNADSRSLVSTASPLIGNSFENAESLFADTVLERSFEDGDDPYMREIPTDKTPNENAKLRDDGGADRSADVKDKTVEDVAVEDEVVEDVAVEDVAVEDEVVSSPAPIQLSESSPTQPSVPSPPQEIPLAVAPPSENDAPLLESASGQMIRQASPGKCNPPFTATKTVAVTREVLHPSALRVTPPSAKKSVTFNEEKNEVRHFSPTEGLHAPITKPVKPLLKRKQPLQSFPSLQSLQQLADTPPSTTFPAITATPMSPPKAARRMDTQSPSSSLILLDLEAAVKVTEGYAERLFARVQRTVRRLEDAIA